MLPGPRLSPRERTTRTVPHPRLAIWVLALVVPLWAPAARADEGDSYRQLEVFARVLSYVENNYVEPVDRERLIQGAVQGMLETLDPHTIYMPPDVFKEMKIDTSGEFGGLGIEITRKADKIVVVAPLDDTPAARAGILAGDELVQLDGESLGGVELAEVLRRMRGPAGKKAILTIMREGFSAPRTLAVVRDHIRIVSVEGALIGGFAHVKIKNFQDRTDLQLRRELERLQGLNGGRPLRGVVLDLRNNPGGLLEQAVAVSDRFLPGNLTIVTTKGRNGRNSSVDQQQGPGHRARLPDGGADERGDGLRLGDRRRRAAGSRPGDAARHPVLREGERADGHRARRWQRAEDDDRALLHAQGTQHPGARHPSGLLRRRGADRRSSGEPPCASATWSGTSATRPGSPSRRHRRLRLHRLARRTGRPPGG